MLSVQRNQQLASRYLVAVNETKDWIKGVTRLPLPAAKKDFEAALADGVILCKLFNEIAMALGVPTVPVIPADKLSYKRIENINSFLEGCKSFGLSQAELFEPIDLFEQKRFPKVINCLRALSRAAALKGFSKQILQKFYDLRSRKILFSDDDLATAQEDIDVSAFGMMFVEMLGLDFEARAEAGGSKEELPAPPPPPRAVTPPPPPPRAAVVKRPSTPSITIDWSAVASIAVVFAFCCLWLWLWTINQRRFVPVK